LPDVDRDLIEDQRVCGSLRMKTKVAIIVFIAVGIAVFNLFDLGRYFTLDELKANKDRLLLLYGYHRFLFAAGYVILYAFSALLFLPIAAFLTIAGGALFGIFTGTILALTGATLGAVMAFSLARGLLRDWVVRSFGEKLETLDRGISEDGLSYLLFLRLVPLFPFFLVNLASGLTNIRTGIYLFGTMLGSIPGTFLYANAGASLASVGSISDITGPRVLASFALLGLFALIPALYRMMSRNRKA